QPRWKVSDPSVTSCSAPCRPPSVRRPASWGGSWCGACWARCVQGNEDAEGPSVHLAVAARFGSLGKILGHALEFALEHFVGISGFLSPGFAARIGLRGVSDDFPAIDFLIAAGLAFKFGTKFFFGHDFLSSVRLTNKDAEGIGWKSNGS